MKLQIGWFWTLFAAMLLAKAAFGQAFTYQGELKQAGLPANGTYDFEFKLFTDAQGGVQVGQTTTVPNVAVTNGRFTALIDPGAAATNPFWGWIQIASRTGGAPTFTPLSPRQRVTPAPFANRALAEWLVPVGSNILSVDASRTKLFLNRTTPVNEFEYFGITVPTVSDDYGGMYIKSQSNDGRPFYGFSVGGRASWTYMDGLSGQWRVYNFGDRIAVTPTGFVGIGETNPAALLDVNGTVRGSTFTYRTPKTEYLSIPAGGFQPTSNQASATVESAVSGTYFAAAVGAASFAAPIQVPHGAVITTIDISVYDNTVGALSGKLAVRPLGAFGYSQNFTTPNSSNGGNTQTISMAPNVTVNNQANSYVLIVECSDWNGTATSIFGARVTYTVSEP